jgi:hypothetical protein
MKDNNLSRKIGYRDSRRAASRSCTTGRHVNQRPGGILIGLPGPVLIIGWVLFMMWLIN